MVVNKCICKSPVTALVLSEQYLVSITILCNHSYFIVTAETYHANKQLYNATVIRVVP